MNLLTSWLSAANPAAVAIVDDNEQLTYGELLNRSESLACRYQSDFGCGKYLLVPAEKTTKFVSALIAASRSGNIPVPIDPAAPVRLVEQIGKRCGDWALVDLSMQAPSGEGQLTDQTASELPALVLFTSGTSGSPKGVPVSWRNLKHSIETVSEYLDYRQHPSAAVVLPVHYSYALLTQVLCMFYVGGCVRLFSSFRNPIKFARLVEDECLETFCGVPSTYHALCAIHRMSPLSMPNVRVLCSAGAAMDKSLMPEIRRIFPSAQFFDNYGMTEATPRISYIADDDPHFMEPTCGRPIDGVEIRVLDENTLEPVSEGEYGIITIRGPNVFDGYLNDPVGTTEAFTADGFLLSGDCGRIRDQYIYITGRIDDIFNVAGEKVSPLEIERALSEHPDIISSAVGKIDDPQRGTQSVAYIEAERDVSRKGLVAFLEERLPPAKIPLRYVKVRGLPMSANGKLQRSRLSPDDQERVICEIN